MKFYIKGMAACLVTLLLSAIALAAGGADLRLLDAVKDGKGDREIIRALLAQKVDINASRDGATALHWAAHRDDLELVDLLVRAGANVNAANDYGVSPLSLACTNGSAAMVEKLLKAGANPNSAQWTGETLLMTCSRSGGAGAVKALLAAGADVNAKESKKGQTALMWAVYNRHSEVVRALVEHGANIRARSKGDIVEPRFLVPARGAKPEVGKGEPAAKAEAVTENIGFTPLLFAAQQGDIESARILLAAGADVNEGTKETGTALIVAAASGQEAFGIFLLEQGAEPNVVDAYGVTPLHFAVREGLGVGNGLQYHPSYRPAPPSMPALARALLARGANPNPRITRDYPGNTWFYRAPRLSMVGATPYWVAAAAYDVPMMRLLLEGGADPMLSTVDPALAARKAEESRKAEQKDAKGGAEQQSASPADYEQRGASPAGKGGVTPLMVAAGLGTGLDYVRTEEIETKALEAVELALKMGNDVNAVADNGRTAMHGAALLGGNRIVQLLADRGARIDVKDRNGMTPWSLSMGLRADVTDNGSLLHRDTADLLQKLGADIKVGEELERARAAFVLNKEAAREAAIKKKEAEAAAGGDSDQKEP